MEKTIRTIELKNTPMKEYADEYTAKAVLMNALGQVINNVNKYVHYVVAAKSIRYELYYNIKTHRSEEFVIVVLGKYAHAVKNVTDCNVRSVLESLFVDPSIIDGIDGHNYDGAMAYDKFITNLDTDCWRRVDIPTPMNVIDSCHYEEPVYCMVQRSFDSHNKLYDEATCDEWTAKLLPMIPKDEQFNDDADHSLEACVCDLMEDMGAFDDEDDKEGGEE